jgi:hypothetical protein
LISDEPINHWLRLPRQSLSFDGAGIAFDFVMKGVQEEAKSNKITKCERYKYG